MSRPGPADWNDEQVTAYMATVLQNRGNARERKLAEKIALGKKHCPGPLCKGAIKPFDEFVPDPKKRIGVSSHCRACMNEARKKRYRAKLEHERGRTLTRYHADRRRAVEIYGGRCERCGDVHRLELDHVDGGGEEHRKVESHKALYRRIAETGHPLDDVRLRLLCVEHHKMRRLSGRQLLLTLMGNDWPALELYLD